MCIRDREEVWPNLEVFFHGGVAFTPYREQYKQVITCLLYTSLDINNTQ